MIENLPPELGAQTREFCVELERALASLPAVDELAPEQTRRERREGRGVFAAPVFLPQARGIEIEGPGGPLPLRIISPADEPAGAFLHLHGGGWTIGDADLQDQRLKSLADETGLIVVSVGYRLAPEHPYPAAPDDCEAAALWLLHNAGELGIGADALLDDSLFMEARWRVAGRASELRVWPEAPHGFVGLPMRIADLTLAAEYAFLRRALRLPGA